MTVTTEAPQSRFTFPEPTAEHRAVMWRILELMKDGQRRSKKEIRAALSLDPDTEIRARIQDLKKPENGAWSFDDLRDRGPDDDGVYRYQLAMPKARPTP